MTIEQEAKKALLELVRAMLDKPVAIDMHAENGTVMSLSIRIASQKAKEE